MEGDSFFPPNEKDRVNILKDNQVVKAKYSQQERYFQHQQMHRFQVFSVRYHTLFCQYLLQQDPVMKKYQQKLETKEKLQQNRHIVFLQKKPD
jgi:hypothetical protein